MLAHFDTAAAVFAADRTELQQLDLPAASLDALRQPDWRRVEQDLAWLERPGNHLLQLNDPRYPLLLRQITYPPPLLFVHGNLESLRAPQLAIVGTRNPTPLGRDTAHHFAAYLAGAGLAVTSGLA
ncbi:MAG: DNA-processing protein DprA, partial [Phycisphaerales bacterium]|nr:DNA-processing protein DprA [Phycisphaerales bacterium]